jgi:hypothetical protein
MAMVMVRGAPVLRARALARPAQVALQATGLQATVAVGKAGAAARYMMTPRMVSSDGVKTPPNVPNFPSFDAISAAFHDAMDQRPPVAEALS